MPRPRKTIPSRKIHLALPAPLLAEIDLLLFSPLEGRVPHGAYSELMAELLQAHLARFRELEKLT